MRKVPLWVLLMVIGFSIIFAVLFGWSIVHIYQHGSNRFSPEMKNAVISIAELPTKINEVYDHFFSPEEPSTRLAVKNDSLKGGLSFKDKNYKTNDYLLVSAFDSLEKQPVIKLVRLSDGKALHKWAPDISSLLDRHKPENNKFNPIDHTNYRIFHPLLLNNGEIVFNDQQQMVKMDKNANVIWFNNRVFHHSIEVDAEGNLWCPSVIEDSKAFQAFTNPYRDDAITKVSPTDGKILYQKSVTQILIDNGYGALIFGITPPEGDALHLNDIQPALTDSKYWLKGDLLISMRNRSTVFLYRPTTNKILWLKTGPWLNQHDCDFLNDHQIGIFGNNIVRIGDKITSFVSGQNDEMVYDFTTSQTSTPYTAMFKTANIATPVQGGSRILPNGDIFAEETTNGRIFVGDTQKVKLQYVERLNNKEISMLIWCRYMTNEEFSSLKF